MSRSMLDRRAFCLSLAGGAAAAAEDDSVSVDLAARTGWLEAGGRPLRLSSYAGQAPGPVLAVKPGDRVKIHFTNLLPAATNLHFHGLHIPCTGNADNGFLHIPPGQAFDYDFEIPRHHPGGTFWYHPHHHGSAASQVSSGLAGAIIVRGVLDEIPEIGQAPERILILQDFAVNAQGMLTEPSMMERMLGREGSLVLVNAKSNPAIPIARNGWSRLRLINASVSRFYRLRIEEHPMYQIASDGGALPAVRELEELLLTPGERAEVMVHGGRQPGDYRLLNLPYDRGRMGGMRAPPPAVTPIGFLSYEGDAEQQMALPRILATVEPLPEPEVRRTFRLGEGIMAFTIDGRMFDARRADTEVRLNAVEEWEFENPTGMDHPMHIHTNSFQPVGPDGQAIPEWKDVVLVKARSSARVRIRFEDFTGPTMYHCHILDHEDLGMMGRLDILP